MRHRALGVVLALVAAAAEAAESWIVVQDTPSERVQIDLSSIERHGGQVDFRERHTLLGGQADPNTLRPLREVLAKRVVDCRTRRIATVSRAVFDTDDALIDHQVSRGNALPWQPLAADDPVARRLCDG